MRAGFAVPKRLGPAVVRNRMKRILRETWRQHPLVGNADVARIYEARQQVLTVMIVVRSGDRDALRLRQDLTHAIDRLDALRPVTSSEGELRG